MKKNLMMQILSFAVLFAFICLPLTVNAQGSKASFAGTWTYNEAKSQAGQTQGPGGGRGFGGGDMVVKQEANLLTVDVTRTGQDGQAMTTSSKYTLDGKESVNSTGRGESKSTAQWASDGKSLTIVTKRTFERDGQTTEMTTSEVWSMAGAGELSVTSTMNTPQGERKSTRYYTKK